MFIRLAFLTMVLLWLAGCAAPGRQPTPLSDEQPLRGAEPAPPIIPLPQPAANTPALPIPPITAPAPTAAGWISLAAWCLQNKLPAPSIHASATQTNIEIRSPQGAFIFEPPRRNARWNGTLIGVGFAPTFMNGQPYVNAIDLQKVLQPLLLPETAPARKTRGIVIIDAGHGGPNLGTLSHDRKLREKELTLDWALRIQKLLEGSSWQAILTRPVDLDLGLTQRVAFADQKNADLFVSLHFNSAGEPKVSGLETYCFTPQGMASHLTRDYADPISESFPNNQFDVENLLLALDLHKSILNKTKATDRGIRRARFMTVLRGQTRPSVLLEGGYLSNPEEARLIATPAYRQKLAEAVAEALGVTTPKLTTSR